LGNYFRNHFYDENKEKIFPWDLSRITKSECFGLVVGLIRSDGWNGKQLGFCNTSSSLVVLCRQALARLGYASVISYRDPRVNEKGINGRIIFGKKIEWNLHLSSRDIFDSLSQIVNNTYCDNSKFIERLFIQDNFICGRIQKIHKKQYSGQVYDLKVEGDHSFCGPGLTIHNCGAGRTNCALSYRGLQVIGMSVARGGDYIDKQVSEQTGIPISQVIATKEKKLDFDNLDFDDDVIFALDAYYEQMIRYVLGHFAKKFQKEKSNFEAPMDIVVAGGTSMPPGFCKKLEKVVRGLDLPFTIKEVRHAENPRTAVVEGLYVQSQLAKKRADKSE